MVIFMIEYMEIGSRWNLMRTSQRTDMPKYKLTDNTDVVNGHTVYRIVATEEFRLVEPLFHHTISVGRSGGFIESEFNLSQIGTSWVGDRAVVYGGARVRDSSVIYGDARVYDFAIIEGNARIHGESVVNDSAIVGGTADVRGDSHIFGIARVAGSAVIVDTRVYERALVNGNARIDGSSIHGDVWVTGNAALNVTNLTHGLYDGKPQHIPEFDEMEPED
jgi:carbonic anhydrase/acetyltransferase-like protein (isoleucine patch superfamily)